MRKVNGDLFAACDWGREGVLVIPTNVGWKSSGENVMGAGVAAVASEHWTTLAGLAGEVYKREREAAGVHGISAVNTDGTFSRLLLFPTKPLHPKFPSRSWQGDATLERIEQSVAALAIKVATDEWELFAGLDYYLPLVGCGAGKLKREDVLPILETYLEGDRFVLVER